MAQVLLIASYLILIRFAADVFTGGFPNSAAVRGFKQSVS